MPGYESKMETGVKEGDPAIPARFLYQNRNRNDKDKGKNRFQPYVRKAIPKRTALVGTAKHECAVLPVYNDEYRQFQLNRTLKEDAPQYSTKFLDDTSVAGNLLMPGTTGNLQNSFTNFIVSLYLWGDVLLSEPSFRCITLLTPLLETHTTDPQSERQQILPYCTCRSYYSTLLSLF